MPSEKQPKQPPADPKPGPGQQRHYVADEPAAEADSPDATVRSPTTETGLPVEEQIDLIRLVRGDKGRVPMRTELIMRFDYGRGIPWVRQHFGGPQAVAGPNALQFITSVELRGTPDLTTIGEFTVAAGDTVPFTMSWYPSHHPGFAYRDPYETLLATETQWLDWSSHCTLKGKWRDAI